MAVLRPLWNRSFRSLPHWPCPRCRTGHLLVVDGSLRVEETGPSQAEHEHEDWDPDWITQRFCGLLKCNDPACHELASISGTSGVSYYIDEDVDGQAYQTIENSLVPKSIYPAPHLFPLTGKCPDVVKEHLVSGFALLWSDYESCANKFRIAVEALLTDRKISTYSKLVKGKPRRPLSLHTRIELFRTKSAEAAECLEAVKWLGNHGSHHANSLSLEDVLDAADILEHAINLIYDPPQSPVHKAKKINKKKGPS